MNISKSYKKLLSLFAALLAVAVLLLGGCGADDKRDDIIVLYTNDVHCSIDDDIGYDGLAAYKKQCKEVTPYVALVDCGDALHGGEYGTVSQGEYPAELMKRAGYDFAVLGDQEFGYGLERLAALMEKSGAQYLGCNITYTGAGESAFLSKLLPCKTVTYGNVKVAFVGVSAPESIVKSVPGYFSDQSGNYVYDFCGASGQTLYDRAERRREPEHRAEGVRRARARWSDLLAAGARVVPCGTGRPARRPAAARARSAARSRRAVPRRGRFDGGGRTGSGGNVCGGCGAG